MQVDLHGVSTPEMLSIILKSILKSGFLSFNREKGNCLLSMNGKFELKNAESTQHFTICQVVYCSSISV